MIQHFIGINNAKEIRDGNEMKHYSSVRAQGNRKQLAIKNALTSTNNAEGGEKANTKI